MTRLSKNFKTRCVLVIELWHKHWILFQIQLKETTESLRTKTDAVAELERQIEPLKSSLDDAKADVEAKGVRLSELETVKSELEKQLKEAQESLSKLQGDHDEGIATLQAVRQEVCLSLASFLMFG